MDEHNIDKDALRGEVQNLAAQIEEAAGAQALLIPTKAAQALRALLAIMVPDRHGLTTAAGYHDAVSDSWKVDLAERGSDETEARLHAESKVVEHLNYANDMRRMAQGERPLSCPTWFAEALPEVATPANRDGKSRRSLPSTRMVTWQLIDTALTALLPPDERGKVCNQLASLLAPVPGPQLLNPCNCGAVNNFQVGRCGGDSMAFSLTCKQCGKSVQAFSRDALSSNWNLANQKHAMERSA
ncbi:hypothetical protein [Pseudomonas sp. EMN2]|uniref:hypothetical protein n=1 Tax=Pseudomonas sp. EMN2 TaxID=2615212 RepID=UPI00129A4529|nr:hypothetical protein [Pseudomonas sp. EMN2]